jgi:predicted nucleic acid-binding protein
MNLALDTNIVVYALTGNEETANASAQALESAASRGGAIVVAAPVYAELLAIPNSKKEDLDAFIADAKILVDWHISESCWIAAGIAFAAYAR